MSTGFQLVPHQQLPVFIHLSCRNRCWGGGGRLVSMIYFTYYIIVGGIKYVLTWCRLSAMLVWCGIVCYQLVCELYVDVSVCRQSRYPEYPVLIISYELR